MQVNFYGLREINTDNGNDIHNNNILYIQPHPCTHKARMLNNDYNENL